MYKLLVLNYFPAAYPPESGDVLRYYHLYDQLSRYYDITLLSQKLSPKVETVRYNDRLLEIQIPMDASQRQLGRKLAVDGIGPRFREHVALCCALLEEPPALFRRYYEEHYPWSDMIVHESPFLLKYDVRFGSDNKPRIYNSHKLEAKFARRVWQGTGAAKYVKLADRLEKQLAQQASLVFVTSSEEKSEMAKAYRIQPSKIELSPDGVIPEQWSEREEKRPASSRTTALFIGCLDQPNTGIAKLILTKLAPKCKNIDFIVAGPCGGSLIEHNVRNVKLLGPVSEQRKLKLFAEADIAINPARFGLGTKVKSLEFLSAGIPLVSTRAGVRGLGLASGKHYVHASIPTFAATLRRMTKRKTPLAKIAAAGQKRINERYAWKTIAASMKPRIDALADSGPDEEQ